MLKDIDPNFRMTAAEENSIRTMTGPDAIVLAIQDCVEEQTGESLFDVDQGGNINDYLSGSVNTLNSILIREIISKSLSNGMDETVLIADEDILVEPDYHDNVYRVHIRYSENEFQEQQPLLLTIKVRR